MHAAPGIDDAGSGVVAGATGVNRGRALETAIVGQGVGGRTIALVPEDEAGFDAHADHVWRLPPVRDDLAPLVYSVPLHVFAYHVTKARDALGLGAPRLGI